MQAIDNIQLTDYSVPQKIHLMEKLWNDLTLNENEFKSPEWHETELKRREKEFNAGNIKASSWEDAKERIRRNVSCK